VASISKETSKWVDIKASFVEGMSEFLEGEVSLVCNKKKIDPWPKSWVLTI